MSRHIALIIVLVLLAGLLVMHVQLRAMERNLDMLFKSVEKENPVSTKIKRIKPGVGCLEFTLEVPYSSGLTPTQMAEALDALINALIQKYPQGC